MFAERLFKWSCLMNHIYYAGEGRKCWWSLLVLCWHVKKNISPRINRTVLSFPTPNIWLNPPPLLWEKSENHGNGHQKTNNFLCRLLTSCFCVWGPNGAVMISRAFAWQSGSQTLLVSPIQTGSSTIATVNCFSLLLRQSQATSSHTLSEHLIKCVLFCFLFFAESSVKSVCTFKNRKCDWDRIKTLSISSRSHWHQSSGVSLGVYGPLIVPCFPYFILAPQINMVCVDCNLLCIANYWLLRAQK